jgi:hypothetical protein
VKSLLMIGLLTYVVLLITPAMRAQNLIQNGSFELPGVSFQQQIPSGSTFLTDWTVSDSGDVFIHNGPANGGDYGPAEDGVDYLDLSGDGSPHATVYQDFSTTPGLQYSLSFYIGSSSYNPQQTIHVFLFENVQGYLLNTTLTPLAPSGNINWLKETFTFTASMDSTRLQFQDTSSIDDNASYIDNVSVTPAPEPATVGLLSLGLLSALASHKQLRK